MPQIWIKAGANYANGDTLLTFPNTSLLYEAGAWLSLSGYAPGFFSDDTMVLQDGNGTFYGLGYKVAEAGFKLDFSDNTVTVKLAGGDWGDSILGGLANDVLKGGVGTDTLAGGTGDDEFTGGTEADRFEFSGRSGDDVITDFEVGVDTIALSDDYDVTIANILSHIQNDANGNAVITLGGGNTITLQGVAKSALTEGDFEIENHAPVITVQSRVDIVVANQLSTTVSVLMGDQSGGFEDEVVYAPAAFSKDVALGDIDGDGDLDMVAINYAFQLMTIWKGDGLGGFTLIGGPPTGATGANAIELGDIDDDGDLDMVVALGTGVGVFLNHAGVYHPMQGYVGVGPDTRDVALGDFDGDGIVDIVMTTASGIEVLTGKGDGTFDPPVNKVVAPFFKDVELVDFNGDGKIDILTSTNSGGTAIAYFTNGVGGLVSSVSYGSSGTSSSFAIGDINGDGLLDLVIAGLGTNLVQTWSAVAPAALVPALQITVEADATSLALKDIDGDGKLDLIATLANGKVATLLGNGAGQFGTATTYSVGTGPVALAIGNLDSSVIADRVTDEETALVFDAAHGNAITLSDLDAGSGFETLTLTVEHGTLTLADTSNLLSVSGDGTDTVTIRGYITRLNEAIDGLIYTPDDNYHGDDELILTLNDEGNTGAAKSATTTISIVVNAVSDAPTTADKTVSATEDTELILGTSTFAFDDADGDALLAVKILSLPTSGVLKLNTITLTAATTVTAAEIAAGKLTYAPASNANGAALASFTFSVQDDSGAASGADTSAAKTVTIDVAAVNDAPTLSLVPIVTTLKETASTATDLKVADITVSDVDGGTNVLSLVGVDKDLFVIKNGDLYLKAGAKLDFETNPKLDVTIRADDATIPGSPDASIGFQLKITDVAELVTGGSSANTLNGSNTSEVIDGKAGNDRIRGNGGNDTIIGGTGFDVMTGGAGADVFKFMPGDLQPPGALGNFLWPTRYDLITDFQKGIDKIDLSALDANTRKSGNQAFHFEKQNYFTRSPGELIAKYFGSNNHTMVQGDTNGDGIMDLRIVLSGNIKLTASDFIL